jgi:uracil phosphoribosyltransferase
MRAERVAHMSYVRGAKSVVKGGNIAMNKLFVMDHPLIQHKVSLMRRKDTGTKEFRELLEEVAMLMAYEVTRDLPLRDIEVETPICTCTAKEIAGKKLAIVPILRAGLGMVDGITKLVPSARVGHIGLYRDPQSLEPVEYYCKLPNDIEERDIILLDPMLATGGSSSAAISFLKKRGCKSIKLMNLIAAPEGIRRVQEDHPDIDIFVAAVDEKLNEHGYIVPGLGDAGDRLFGTK